MDGVASPHTARRLSTWAGRAASAVGLSLAAGTVALAAGALSYVLLFALLLLLARVQGTDDFPSLPAPGYVLLPAVWGALAGAAGGVAAGSLVRRRALAVLAAVGGCGVVLAALASGGWRHSAGQLPLFLPQALLAAVVAAWLTPAWLCTSP